jgi:hypothetical protein
LPRSSICNLPALVWGGHNGVHEAAQGLGGLRAASERDLVRRRRAPKRLHGSRLIRTQGP